MSFAEESLLRRRRRNTLFSAVFLIGLIVLVFQFSNSGRNASMDHSMTGSVFLLVKNAEITTPVPLFVSHRKILQAPEGSKVETERIWNDKCSTSDILISQGPTEPMPNGIPTYTVEISNVSPTGSDISGIHVSCGWFSSARLINPKVFKRLYYNDCLVNNGQPLVNGGTVSFQYANTYSYQLSVNSVRC